MQFTQLLLAALFAGSSIAVPSPSEIESRGLCKEPKCTSHCPDGTKYNCCVDYIRDPCTDHQKCEWAECICKCKDGITEFLCNAQYFRDPCAPLP